MEECSVAKRARLSAADKHITYREALEKLFAEKRPMIEKVNNAEQKLKAIHLQIVKNESLFIEERKKWVAMNGHLRSNMNLFFSARCLWETEFKETHFKPLYEERRIHAESVHFFWVRAMCRDKLVSKQKTPEDQKALKYLKDIESSRTPNLKGFELKFIFHDNPYFKNNTLTKKYDVTGETDSASLKAIGTKIDWYPSHDLTKKRGKRCKSFFHFFKSYATVEPLSFDIEADELKGDLPEDYEIGTKFRDKIIPHAASTYVYCGEQASEFDDDDSDDAQSGR